MAGAELIGKEEIKEVMDVLETGILMRYGFDKERKGIFKVREFEEAFAKYCGASYALGCYFRFGGAQNRARRLWMWVPAMKCSCRPLHFWPLMKR